MKKIIIFVIPLISGLKLMAQTPETHCYESATYANLAINQNVEEITKEKSRYSFTIKSLQDSVGPILAVRFVSREKIENIEAPQNWNFNISKGREDGVIGIRWSGSNNLKNPGEIIPGESLKGFVFEGPSRYGLIPLKISNSYNIRTRQNAKLSNVLRTEDSICPGSWSAGSTTNGDKELTTMIFAPVSKSIVSPTILIKRSNERLWTGAITQQHDLIKLSPLDKGTVKILILDSSEYSLEDIDIASLRFGRAKAKVKSNRYLEAKAIGDIHKESKILKDTKKTLELEFDLSDLNIVCELDHALFLDGTLKSGKKIMSGVKIKPTKCTQETFAKEAVGILKINKEIEAQGGE